MITDPDKPDDDEELIDDLESIKQLLDPPEDESANVSASEEVKDIPMLDDAVGASNFDTRGLADDAFKALLDDAWQDSVQDVLGDARETIESHSTAWHPQDTDELNQALKIRIDNSVRQWLEETLQANIAELRKRIVHELSTEIVTHFNEKIGTAVSKTGTGNSQDP